MLHTFKIMLLSYKQAYRKQPPGLHAHFTKRSCSRQNWNFVIVYSWISFYFWPSLKQKVLARMSNLGNGKATKKYHKSSSCDSCAIFQVFRNHTRVYSVMILLSAVVLKLRTNGIKLGATHLKAPFLYIYILWLSHHWNTCIILSNMFILKYE